MVHLRHPKHHGRKFKGYGSLPTALPIETRPVGANTEEVIGETDNIGTIKTDKTGIAASIKRKSRVIRLGKLSDLKAITKRTVLTTQMKKEDKKFQKTMRIDKGSENSQHETISSKLMLSMYFCQVMLRGKKELLRILIEE